MSDLRRRCRRAIPNYVGQRMPPRCPDQCIGFSHMRARSTRERNAKPRDVSPGHAAAIRVWTGDARRLVGSALVLQTRWFPIVSAVQAVGDMLDQLGPPPGFEHDYSTEYVRAGPASSLPRVGRKPTPSAWRRSSTSLREMTRRRKRLPGHGLPRFARNVRPTKRRKPIAPRLMFEFEKSLTEIR